MQLLKPKIEKLYLDLNLMRQWPNEFQCSEISERDNDPKKDNLQIRVLSYTQYPAPCTDVITANNSSAQFFVHDVQHRIDRLPGRKW